MVAWMTHKKETGKILLRILFSSKKLFPPIPFILTITAGMIIFLVIQSSLHSTLLFRERKDWLIPARNELYSLKNEELLNRIYPHILNINRKEFRHRLEFLKRQKLSVFKDHNFQVKKE